MLTIRQTNAHQLGLDKKGDSKLEKPIQKSRLVVIGAAGKKGNEYLNTLMKRNDIEIAAVVINKKTSPTIDELEKKGIKVIKNGKIDTLLATVVFDTAVMSVPHSEHDSMTQALLGAGKYIIKEKPLAMTAAQTKLYHDLIKEKNIAPIFTTVQRDTLPAFINSKKDLSLIGQLLKFEYHYCFNLPTVTTGWRAKKEIAGGGVILDMGYHAIDVITKFFGAPKIIFSLVGYQYPETAKEELEDAAEIFMEYPLLKLKGRLLLNRHASEKKEIFKIHGTYGQIEITPQGYQIFNLTGELIKKVACPISKEEEISDMFKHAIPYHQNSDLINQAFLRNIQNIKIIEDIYASNKLTIKEIKEPEPMNLNSMGIFSKPQLGKPNDTSTNLQIIQSLNIK